MKYTRSLKVAAALAGICLLVLLRVFDPSTSGVFPPCPVRYLTGWYCPGCGSLRALHQLLEGNLQAAWAMNPLAILLMPFLAYGLASHAWFEFRGRHLPTVLLPGAWIRAFAVVIVAYGVARNLPYSPFDLLAPGAMLPR